MSALYGLWAEQILKEIKAQVKEQFPTAEVTRHWIVRKEGEPLLMFNVKYSTYQVSRTLSRGWLYRHMMSSGESKAHKIAHQIVVDVFDELDKGMSDAELN